MPKFLVLTAFLVAGFAFGQIEEVRRITKTLCSPEFHGRGYYAKGDSIAADFLRDEFKKLGIEPFKGNEYLQHFIIEGVNVFGGDARVNQGSQKLVPGVHFLVDPESGGGEMTINPVVLDGQKLVANTESGIDNDYINGVFQDLRNGTRNGVLVDLSKVTGDSLNNLIGLSHALAESFPVIEVMNRKFTWSVGRKQLPNPLIYIQDSIYREGQTFRIDIEAEWVKSYRSQNVVAYLPAKKKCAKTVVFTAHYDHLGRMGHDIYFPGANDNASGTAMLLTMANYFKKNPPKYNVMFIAFGGEEAGLLGSKYYVENPMEKLKKIRFLMNLDIMGSGEEGITAVNATVFPEEFALLQKINERDQLLTKVKKRGPARNSDHYWFTEKGVPAFFIYTMGPNKHYHDIFDEYEELSFKEYEDITSLLITFLKELDQK